MDSLMVIFIKKEIQRRQNDQDSRCHQYDLALQREALDPVLVCSELMPGANPTIENRCKSMGVILVDGFALDCTADLICAAVDELAEED